MHTKFYRLLCYWMVSQINVLYSVLTSAQFCFSRGRTIIIFCWKIMMPVRQNICERVYDSYAQVRARIFTKKNLVVKSYLMNLSFKFPKDPSFRWGDIPLFVTVYDLELKILSFLKPPKNAILSANKTWSSVSNST